MKEKSKYQFNSKKELDNFLAGAKFSSREAMEKYIAEQTNPAWEKPIINENKNIIHKAEEDLAKAKADVESIKAKAEADVLKVKADYELAQKQKADNERAIQMAKENNQKVMNPILKKSLIALGVIGVVIGVYLLIKKNKK